MPFPAFDDTFANWYMFIHFLLATCRPAVRVDTVWNLIDAWAIHTNNKSTRRFHLSSYAFPVLYIFLISTPDKVLTQMQSCLTLLAKTSEFRLQKQIALRNRSSTSIRIATMCNHGIWAACRALPIFPPAWRPLKAGLSQSWHSGGQSFFKWSALPIPMPSPEPRGPQYL